MEELADVQVTPDASGGIESPTTMDSTIAKEWESISKNLTSEVSEVVARDSSGRFTKRELDASAPEVTPAPTAAPVAQEQVEQPQEDIPAAPSPEASKAPGSWKAEAKALFDKLDPLVQQEVLRREGDFHKGIESYKARAQVAERFEQAIAPYLPTIQKLGVSPEQAVSALMRADHTLRHAPPAVKAAEFQKLAQMYGIDLSQEIDPNVAALQNEVYQLREQQRLFQEQQQQQVSQTVNTDIERFASEPGHEHFEVVRAHMAALLQGGQAKDLQDAYDQAVYATPQTRNALIAQQLEKQRAEARKKAEEAKKAAAVNVPARGAIAAAGPRGSIEDTIRAEAERLGFGNR